MHPHALALGGVVSTTAAFPRGWISSGVLPFTG
jgi:hypothetical protein